MHSDSLNDIVFDSENVPPIMFDEENLELTSEEQFSLSLKRKDFNDNKELIKFVKSVEGIVRKSVEYREWVDYIKQVLGHFSCEVTGEIGSQVTIEIHHHPIALFDITTAVTNKYILEEREFCSFDIAYDVIRLHFQGNIGFVPLVKTMHEKVHNGFLSLPMNIIHGNWMYMLENYTFEDDTLERIQLRTAMNKENCGWMEGEYFWTKDNYPSKRH